MFKRILVPTDGSDITAKAITTSIDLARSVNAQLYTISVKEPFPYSAISEMQPTPDRKSTRLNSSHRNTSRMPSSA